MARQRTVTVGIDSPLFSTGTAPWEVHSNGGGYLCGPRDDSGPLAALLLADLRRAYNRNHIPHLHATLFELHHSTAHIPFRRLAGMFGIHHTTAAEWVNHVGYVLDRDPLLGLVTTIREEFGWPGVGELLF